MKAWKALRREHSRNKQQVFSSLPPTLPTFHIPEFDSSTWTTFKSPEAPVELWPHPKRIERRLPVEIWRDIFILASTTPGRDEFSIDASAYRPTVCEEQPTQTTPSHDEDSKAIKARFKFIQVCKHWYSSGIRVLWSHLRVNLEGRPSAFESMYKQLCAVPALATCVIRLDYIGPLGHDQHFYDWEKLLVCRPSLKIILCPLSFGLSMYRCYPDVVILQSYHPGRITGVIGMDFWRSARVMRLDCGLQSIIPVHVEDLEFPRLESLSITDKGGTMTGYIMEYWHAPSLRTLTINCTRNAPYKNFLEKHGQHLEKLELKAPIPFIRDETLRMITLRTLYVDFNCHGWLEVVDAPILNRIGIFNVPVFGADLCAESINHFPTVKEICFHGSGTKDEKNSNGWNTHTLKWGDTGVFVEFR